MVVAIIAGVGYALWTLRGPETESRGGVLGAIPEDLPAIQAQIASVEKFGTPLLTRIIVVSSYEGDLSPVEQGELAAKIVSLIDEETQEQGFVAGLPVPEVVWPGSRASGDTVVLTYLFFDLSLSTSEQLDIAEQFSERLESATDASFAGVTGAIKASDEQRVTVNSYVHWIEAGTLALVFGILALRYRSLLAPLVALLAGGVAYAASMALLAAAQDPLDLSISTEVRPLLVVLIFGVVTDYTIFYLGSFRHALAEGEDTPAQSAWRTWRTVTPIVTAAALIVMVGGLALYLAEINIIRSMAPAIAMAIGLSWIASVSFTPLLLSLLGTLAFWPDNPLAERHSSALRGWMERQIVKRWVAIPALIVLSIGLGFAAYQAKDAQVATTLIRDLPSDNVAARAERIASRSVPSGAVGPTVLVVNGPTSEESLSRLGKSLRESSGVAAVLGPESVPDALDLGLFRTSSGDGVRYLIVFDSDPYGAQAINDYRNLVERLPSYLAEANMVNVQASLTGDTAVSSQVSDMAFDDLLRVGVAVIVLELVLLLVFLRSLLAPPLLLAVTILLVAASLGTTAILSGLLLGHESLSFLVPIATMVLLLSLGADYNLFLIGQVWSAQRRLPFTEALARAATETSSTILTAGLALTAAFAILAVVPLASFRQIALAMSIGLLADTLVIRPLLVPALLATLRRVATWPAPQLDEKEEGREEPRPSGARSYAATRKRETNP